MLNFESLNESDLSIDLKLSEWYCLLVFLGKISKNEEINEEDIDIVKTIAPNIYFQFKPISDKIKGIEKPKNRITSLDDYRRKRISHLSKRSL